MAGTAGTDWNGGNRAAWPDTPYGSGYDVKTTAMQANESGANASLTDLADNTWVKLTIIAIQADLSLAGTEGQSKMQKDFYPRNFKQPSFNIAIQTRSQEEMGRVSEFVHKAQRNAVSQGSLMRLIVPSGGLRHTEGTIDRGGMRGVRKGIQMTGYINSIPRTHARFDPAPVLTFDFIVAQMESGPFQDEPYKVYKLAKWSQIVDALLDDNFIGAPNVEEDKNNQKVVDSFKAVAGWLGDLVD